MSPGRLWQGLAVLTAALYGGLAWVWFAELVPAAGGLTPFDGRLSGYTAEEGDAFLQALTPTGREVYLGTVRSLDTLFPICLAATLAAPILYLGKGVWRVLAFLPLGYMAVDLMENAQVARLLQADVTTAEMFDAASRLTVTKYALLVASMIALVAVFMRTRRP